MFIVAFLVSPAGCGEAANDVGNLASELKAEMHEVSWLRNSSRRSWGPHRARVAFALSRDPWLADDQIVVRSSPRTVALRGSVDTERERERAGALARSSLEAEILVENDLLVLPPPGPSGRRALLRMQEALADRIAAFGPAQVHLSGLRRVRALLTGSAGSRRSHRRMLDAIRRTPGISKLVDRTTVCRPQAIASTTEVPSSDGGD